MSRFKVGDKIVCTNHELNDDGRCWALVGGVEIGDILTVAAVKKQDGYFDVVEDAHNRYSLEARNFELHGEPVKYTNSADLEIGTRYLFTDEDDWFDERLAEPFEATYKGKNTIYAIDGVNFTQSINNTSGRWSAVELVEDVGTDLLGIKLTTGGDCVYTIASSLSTSAKPVLDLTWRERNGRIRYAVSDIRRRLANGSWKVVDEHDYTEPMPPVDTGSDLVGKKFHYKENDTVYTISEVENNRVTVVWDRDLEGTHFSVKSARTNIKDGGWVLHSDAEMPELEPTGINKGDYFRQSVSPTETLTMCTAGKKYQCIRRFDDNKIRFINDAGEEDWHYARFFTKVAPSNTVKVNKHVPMFDNEPNKLINQEEKETMSKSTTIEIQVSTAPFAKTEVVTIFGEAITDLNEYGLRSALQRIAHAKSDLNQLDLGKVISGSYQDRELKALTSARTAVIDALDALEA